MGPAAVDALRAALGAALAADDGATGEGAALGEGAVLPHAAARDADTAIARTRQPRGAIT